MSPFLGMFFGLWIIHMVLNFILGYEMVKKPEKDPSEIGPQWLCTHASEQH
jgi:hypothetical protein